MKRFLFIIAMVMIVIPLANAQKGEEECQIISKTEKSIPESKTIYFETKCADGLLGAQSAKSKTIVPCKFKIVWYSDGVFFAEDPQGYVSCYKKNGKCVIGLDSGYKYITPFIVNNDDMVGYIVSKEETKYGLCNTKGKQIIPPLYDDISYFPGQRTFLVKKDTLHGIIDSYGNEIIPVRFPELHYDNYLGGYFFKGQHGMTRVIIDNALPAMIGTWKGDEWLVVPNRNADDGVYLRLRVYETAERQAIQARNAESFANALGFVTSVVTSVAAAALSPSSSYRSSDNYSSSSSSSSSASSNSDSDSETTTKSSSAPRTCTMCNGTGKVIKESGAAQFGLTEKYCDICQKKVPGNHTHGQCPACRGKGHR